MDRTRIPQGEEFPDWKEVRERIHEQTERYVSYVQDHPLAPITVPASFIVELSKVLKWEDGYTLLLEEYIAMQEEELQSKAAGVSVRRDTKPSDRSNLATSKAISADLSD